jgi:PAS domain S-box-containing protein
MEAWLLRDLPQARILAVDSTEDALAAVSQGLALAYVGNLATASHIIERKGLVNLGVVAPSGYDDETFAMGVRRDWPELVALLDRAFAEMPAEEWRTLRQRWLAVRYDHGLRWTDILLWVLAVAAVALLFIVQLRRMVNARTRELAREVERRREGEARFRLLIERAPEAILLLDPATGAFIDANPRAERIYGVPRQRIVGSRPADFSPPLQPDGEASEAKARRHVEAARSGDEQVFPWLHRHPDGSEIPCEVRLTGLPWDGRTIVRCSVLELTERQRYEARLRRSETLANLGLLAGCVAHDFNNTLTGILGFAELIGQRTADATARDHAATIVRAVAQAKGQTARLMAFARQGAATPGPYDAHAAIASALDLFAAARPRDITTVRELAAPRSQVLGFPGLLQNAVLNLCFNARDAMPRGGRIVVGSGLEELDGEAVARLAPYPLAPGPHLHLTIADEGAGMEPAVLARCCEPLFTTKGEQGTGLGLPSVHGCMLEHHGALRIDSAPGRGTCVHLWLPLPAAPLPA